ncbi:hypothetical protein GYMLUDRAFT_48141 [Collybiopsis luxurians FD-317 M1]|uniref:Chromosome transmission fidelity protein 8 n=1 Tax=Collybiopsis luxurians FD-317 M1 TaxID=944289 RepID=A0A0D0AX44_9AGAR|nr:hypothetical protein GYMLUDRAFT_48141 [Collybiopsis luxurians FD-317 M1]
MIIPISFPSSSSSSSSSETPKLPPSLAKISHDEVVLVELQGALELQSDPSSHPKERDGKFVGTLSIDEDLKRPTLRIGHHLLEGKIANLAKPLAVLHRARSNARAPVKSRTQTSSANTHEGEGEDEDEDVAMDTQAEEGAGNDEELVLDPSDIQWNAVAVIKRKIVFSKRPMVIVGRPS